MPLEWNHNNNNDECPNEIKTKSNCVRPSIVGMINLKISPNENQISMKSFVHNHPHTHTHTSNHTRIHKINC